MANERALAVVESAEDFKTRLEQYGRLAKGVCEGGLVPERTTPAAVVVIMQIGHDLGLPVGASFQNIHVVNGRATLSGKLAVGLIRRSGLCKHLDFGVRGEGEEMEGWARSQRKDDTAQYERTFSWKDAKRAGLAGKDNWKKYPQRMLMWRAVGYLADDVYADAMLGAVIADPLDVSPAPMRDVTPEPSKPQPAAAATVLDVIGVKAPEPGEDFVSGSPDPEPPASQPHPPSSADDGDQPPVHPGEPEVDPNTGERVPSQEELDRQYQDDELQAAFDEFEGFKK